MYTKGEWKASPTHNFTGTLVSYITCGDKTIAQTRLNDTDDTLDINQANAHLIAAAPDLYEVLKALLSNGWNAAISELAERAINKAEGK